MASVRFAGSNNLRTLSAYRSARVPQSLSNPVLRIRIFGVILVVVLGLAQLLSLVVLPLLLDVHITRVTI